MLVFLLWIGNNRQELSLKKLKTPGAILFFLFLVEVLLSIGNSHVFFLGMYGFLKLIEFSFLGFYVSQFFVTKQNYEQGIFILSVSVITESLIAIGQYLIQGSLGGVFYFLGERTFSIDTPGIATAAINGQKILRVYGTFSHPNVLAGYLTLSLLFIFFTFINTKSLSRTFFLGGVVLLGSIALFLTLSREAIVLFIAASGFLLLKKYLEGKKKGRDALMAFLFVFILIGIFLLSPLRYRFLESSLSEESFVVRKELIVSSFTIIMHNPFLGVGLNNFLPFLAKVKPPYASVFYLQPVHNIFLLTIAEVGMLGFFFLVYFIIHTYIHLIIRYQNEKKVRQSIPFFFIVLFTCLLAFGFFDHYLFTLQQGQLLFTFVSGIVWVKYKD